MMSTRTHTFIFRVLGFVYLVAALIAFDNAAIAWRTGGTLMAFFLLFGGMYLAFSCLFFARQWWILVLAALNLLVNLGLWGQRSYLAHSVSWVAVVIIGINALLVWYLYRVRGQLADSTLGRTVAALAVLCGAVALYLVINQ